MKRNSLILVLLFSLITPFLVFNGCGKKEDKKIKVGVILPFTGDLASYGEPMRIGMEMALEKLNENDSLQFELIYIDSKAEPTTALNGLQKLLNIDKVKYVIGDVSSPVTLALVPIIEKNKVLLISPGASSPKLENISPYFVRNYPSSVVESYESAVFLAKTKNTLNSAIVYVNSEYGIGLRDVFIKTYEELGGKIVFQEGYDVGRNDFRNIIAKLNQTKPDAIYLGGNQKEMGIFIRQLREFGSKVLVLSNISFLQDDCLNVAGKSADGVIVPVAYYNPLDSTYRGAHNFAKLFNEKFNKEVTIPFAVGYDALMLIYEGIKKFGDNPEKVAEYLRDLKNYDGALGLLNFKDGDVRMPIEFKIVLNGKPQKLTI